MTAVPTAPLDAVDLGRAVGGVGGMGSIGWVWDPVLGGSRGSRLCLGKRTPASLRLPGSIAAQDWPQGGGERLPLECCPRTTTQDSGLAFLG